MTKKAKGGRGKGRSIQTEEEQTADDLLNAPARKDISTELAQAEVADEETQDLLDTLAGLTTREMKFVAEYMKCGVAAKAARAAGYDNRNPLVRNKKLSKAVSQLQRSIAIRLNYSVVRSMGELEDAMVFAKDTENAMALVRAIETRAKIAGHMQADNQIVLPSLNFTITGIKQPEYLDVEVVEVIPDGD